MFCREGLELSHLYTSIYGRCKLFYQIKLWNRDGFSGVAITTKIKGLTLIFIISSDSNDYVAHFLVLLHTDLVYRLGEGWGIVIYICDKNSDIGCVCGEGEHNSAINVSE